MAEVKYKIDGYAGQPVTLPTINSLNWKKDNYMFLGWGKSKGTTVIETRDGGTVAYDGDTDLYAIWAPTDYFYVKALESKTLSRFSIRFGYYLDIKLEYSLDNKETWKDYNNSEEILLNEVGDKCFIRAKDKNVRLGQNDSRSEFQTRFTINSGNCSIGGNIMSLLDNTMLQDYVPDYCFHELFRDCDKLISAEDLKLPAMKIDNHCYDNMFYSCNALLEPPKELPAVDLYNYCYYGMFLQCTKLKKFPSIAGKTLKDMSTSYMFRDTYIKDAYIKLNIELTHSLGARTMFDNHGQGLSVEVDFTSWENVGATDMWLRSNELYNAGTFICPQELKDKFDSGSIERGDTTVPANWTIVAK